MNGSVLKLSDFMNLENGRLTIKLQQDKNGKFKNKSVISKYIQLFEVDDELICPYLLMFAIKKGELSDLNINKNTSKDGTFCFEYSNLLNEVNGVYSVEDINKALLKVSTHNFKIPDPRENTFLVKQPEHLSTHQLGAFLYSDNVQFAQSYCIIDGVLGKYKFITKQFVYKDKLTSIIDEIIAYQNTGIESGILHVSSELFGFDLSQVKYNHVARYTDPPTNQILWPIDDKDGFIAISSAPSIRVLCYLQQMLAYNEDHFIDSGSFNVGGNKPQNAGVVNNELVGKIKVIKNSYLPKYTKASVDIASLTYSIFDLWSLLSLDRVELPKFPDQSPHLDAKSRRKSEIVIDDALVDICSKIEKFNIFVQEEIELSNFIKSSSNGQLLFSLLKPSNVSERAELYNKLLKIFEQELSAWCRKIDDKYSNLRVIVNVPTIRAMLVDHVSQYLRGVIYA